MLYFESKNEMTRAYNCRNGFDFGGVYISKGLKYNLALIPEGTSIIACTPIPKSKIHPKILDEILHFKV